MTGELVITLAYLSYLRRTVKKFSPDPLWQEILKYSFFVTLAIAIIGLILKINSNLLFLWTFFEAALVYITFKYNVFEQARRTMYGLLPLMILLFIERLIQTISVSTFDQLDNYFNIAKSIALTWMVAMIWLSGRQRKALEKERQKRLAEEERHRQIEDQNDKLERLVAERTQELTQQKDALEETLAELKSTQKQLVHSEKMASLGELTAGIAHEIQNPLNFVNNFSEVSVELLAELSEELRAGNTDMALDIAHDIEKNLEKITHHGKRADGIVKGMLQHSRSSTGTKELTDINELADEYFRLSYHGLRAKDKNFNAALQTDYDDQIGLLKVVPQDFGRVMLNLFTNAFYAVSEKRKKLYANDLAYEPKVSVETKLTKSYSYGEPDTITITVSDNGFGIPSNVLEKIYQPFFTTKPAGEGTGLGLSLSYDIITKGHGGKMEVKTKTGEFAKFIVQIPALRE